MGNLLFQTILDIIYPVRCPVCGEIVVPKEKLICDKCMKKLTVITEPRCKKCSKPIEQEEKEFCSDCEHKNYHFIKGYSLWVYDGDIKKSIADFKYHNKKENAKYYIREILSNYGDEIRKLSPVTIVPVPLYRGKYKERGYNQADILARGIAKELELPVLSDLLIRNRKTLPQKQLSDKERLRNLSKAFEFNIEAYGDHADKLNNILLIDDIYTTGSTIEACANVLIRQGISNVYFVTLCIGKGF